MILCHTLLWRLEKLAEVQGVFFCGMEISRGLLNVRVPPRAQGAPAVTSCWTLKDSLGKHCYITASSLKHCPLLATGHYTRYSCLTQNSCFYILVSATRRLGQPQGEPLGIPAQPPRRLEGVGFSRSWSPQAEIPRFSLSSVSCSHSKTA